jgi:2-polyprenyl-3-methyl-5-hydroxy-6-metoxy-1,4-benzoquinol methylase
LRDADASNGWEAVAQQFIAVRSMIGADTLRHWLRALPTGAAVLDLGCGAGVPVTQVLVAQGCCVYGIDASPALVAAYREHFPSLPVACETVEASAFFGRRFDAVVGVGLMFLLTEATQRALIAKVAAALEPGGRFLFTAPWQDCSWTDLLTGRTARSLGTDAYERACRQAGLVIDREFVDEGENHYFDCLRR